MRRSLLVLLAGGVVLTAPIAAQEKATELSVGMLGLQSTSFGDDGGSVFTALTGGGYVAVGFYLSPALALEPTLAASYIDFGDGDNFTSIGFGIGLPYYFRKNWGRSGPYLEPRITYNIQDCDGCDGVSQFAAGAALGTKLPLGDQAAMRAQIAFDYGFENDDLVSSTTFGGSLGLSVFLP